MKRLFLILSTMFLVFVLSACSDDTPNEHNENNMLITIQNKADFEYYGLELAIQNHTQGSVNADGSIIEKEEKLRFEFLEEDFELDGKVDMEVFILTDTNIEIDRDRVPLSKKVTLELHPNQEVFFELTGDSIKEADLKRVE